MTLANAIEMLDRMFNDKESNYLMLGSDSDTDVQFALRGEPSALLKYLVVAMKDNKVFAELILAAGSAYITEQKLHE